MVIAMKNGMSKRDSAPGRMPGAGNGALREGENERATVAANAGVRSLDVGRKSRRSPAQETFNVLGGCAKERARSADESVADRRAVKEAANQRYQTGRRREEAAEAPSAHQPQGVKGKREGIQPLRE